MQKQIIMLGLIVGSVVGGYIPALFGVGLFSLTSIITSALGGFLGIYICYKITQDW